MEAFKCFLLSLFHSSCVFIRVTSYATSLHYSHIYENDVLCIKITAKRTQAYYLHLNYICGVTLPVC